MGLFRFNRSSFLTRVGTARSCTLARNSKNSIIKPLPFLIFWSSDAYDEINFRGVLHSFSVRSILSRWREYFPILEFLKWITYTNTRSPFHFLFLFYTIITSATSVISSKWYFMWRWSSLVTAAVWVIADHSRYFLSPMCLVISDENIREDFFFCCSLTNTLMPILEILIVVFRTLSSICVTLIYGRI